MKNKKILITGALGQNGIILSQLLTKKKYQVYGWIKNKKYNHKIKSVNYEIINLEKKKYCYKMFEKN